MYFHKVIQTNVSLITDSINPKSLSINGFGSRVIVGISIDFENFTTSYKNTIRASTSSTFIHKHPTIVTLGLYKLNVTITIHFAILPDEFFCTSNHK